jgi:iron(III) transport system permease protein
MPPQSPSQIPGDRPPLTDPLPELGAAALHRKSSSSLRWHPWSVITVAIAAVISTPLLAVLAGSWTDARAVWLHLAETVLLTYVLNSLGLMLGVGVGVAVIGTTTAWLVTLCRFPGRRWLSWALLLPLAAPAYILAYAYTDWLDYYGPVQTGLRSLFSWQSSKDYWFPPVRSIWGAMAMLVLVLYPYVYLLARSAFLTQAGAALEASRSLGCGPWQSFWRVALPLARPNLVVGVSLALMETLNDYATVQFFGVDTFTTGIYRTWFGLGERAAATQLSAVLLLLTFGLIALEKRSRGRSQYYQTTTRSQPPQPYHLGPGAAIGAIILCLVPLVLGFGIPAGLLAQMTWENRAQAFGPQFWELASHSITLAATAAAGAVLIAAVLAYGVRLAPTPLLKAAAQLSALGYAVPGAVIAVGIMLPLGQLDNQLDSLARSLWNTSTGLLLSGTLFALVFAYLVRFLALALGSVETGLGKIKPSLDDAARSLGRNPTQTLVQVHLPLLWKAILAAAILVFVDVMKELSATVIIRPFNFDTLAIHVYNLAADERLAQAASSALAIVGVGLVPVILLSWQIEREHPGSP